MKPYPSPTRITLSNIMTTRHAAKRWQERVEDVPLHIAFRNLEYAIQEGITIPPRMAWKFHPVLKHHGKKKQARFYVTSGAMIVVRRETMVTVLPFSSEAYICVLVWKLFGCLPLEYPEWGRLPVNNINY